jgi:hypothetical protein
MGNGGGGPILESLCLDTPSSSEHLWVGAPRHLPVHGLDLGPVLHPGNQTSLGRRAAGGSGRRSHGEEDSNLPHRHSVLDCLRPSW